MAARNGVSAQQRISELLSSFAGDIADAQLAQDRFWGAASEAFAQSLAAVRGTAAEHLLLEIPPAQMALQETTVSAAAQLRTTIEREFAIHAQLINLGYERRYAAETYTAVNLEFAIRRTPLDHLADKETKKSADS